MEDQKEGINDLIKRFPLVPWPRPLPMHSFLNSMPDDSSNLRNEKQDLLPNIEGNPFIRTSRPHSLASFISTRVLNLMNSDMGAETNNLKNKLAKDSVLSESVEGYRGHNDVDSLLEYINSSDKKNESVPKGSKKQLSTSKNSILKEHDKKISSNKKKRKSKKKSIPPCSNKFDLNQSGFVEKDMSSEIAEKLGFVLINKLSSDDDSSSTCSLSAEELKSFTILDLSQKESN